MIGQKKITGCLFPIMNVLIAMIGNETTATIALSVVAK
jgi:hypothetical protein